MSTAKGRLEFKPSWRCPISSRERNSRPNLESPPSRTGGRCLLAKKKEKEKEKHSRKLDWDRGKVSGARVAEVHFRYLLSSLRFKFPARTHFRRVPTSVEWRHRQVVLRLLRLRWAGLGRDEPLLVGPNGRFCTCPGMLPSTQK